MPTDLRSKILERLDAMDQSQQNLREGIGKTLPYVSALVRALRGEVERHEQATVNEHDCFEHGLFCRPCGSLAWPCPSLRSIAAALGVSDAD
jgi:hypothetical protein